MPNSASAKKRLRQAIKQTAKNRSLRSAMKTQVRKVRDAVAAGNSETCQAEFRAAVKELDRAASRRIIHPNAAARTKSRLSKAVKAVTVGAAKS